MEQQCRICQMSFDESNHLPIKICSNRHICCQACFSQIFQKDLGSLASPCPYCRQPISRNKIPSIKQQALKDHELKKWQHVTYQQINQANTSLNRRQRNSLIWSKHREAKIIFGFEFARQFLQRQIELYSDIDSQFIGLGSQIQSKGFGDDCSYDWYESHYRIAELSLYDQLALILMLEQPARMNSRWYESMQVKDPSNYRAMFGLGVLYHNKRFFQTALEIYQKVIGLRSNFDKPYEMMAFIYLEEKNLKLAQKFASQCLIVNPDNIFSQLILLLSIDGLTSLETLQRLQKIIKIQPKFVQALDLYGQQLSKIGQHKRANQIYQKCLEFSPSNIHLLIKRAKNLIALQQYSQVISSLKQISHQNNLLWSLNDDRNYYLGIAYDHFEMKDKSIQHYIRADQRRHIDLPLRKAEAYYQLAQWKLAIENYKKCYENGQKNLTIIMKIVACYRQINEFKEKVEWLQIWHNLQPENNEISFQLGTSCQNSQMNDKSLRFYKKCLEKGYKLHEVYPRVVEILRLQDQCQQSFRYAKEFRNRCNLSQKQKSELLKQDKLNEIRQSVLKRRSQKRSFW